MYVDDLATSFNSRRQGFGESLLQWLIALAKNERCTHMMLDSAIHRAESHQLYRKMGMKEACLHFEIDLNTAA